MYSFSIQSMNFDFAWFYIANDSFQIVFDFRLRNPSYWIHNAHIITYLSFDLVFISGGLNQIEWLANECGDKSINETEEKNEICFRRHLFIHAIGHTENKNEFSPIFCCWILKSSSIPIAFLLCLCKIAWSLGQFTAAENRKKCEILIFLVVVSQIVEKHSQLQRQSANCTWCAWTSVEYQTRERSVRRANERKKKASNTST